MGLELQLQHWGVRPYHHPKANSPGRSNAIRRIRRRRRTSGVFCWTLSLWEWNSNSSQRSNKYNYYKYTLPLPTPNSSTIISIPSRKKTSSSKISAATITSCLLKLGFDDIAAVVHNKVLIAAVVSATVGQLSKPFTSKLLSGKTDVDFKAAVQSGGFPSSHSSVVVATATSLALERGFSDSIVGLTFVYAGLVMYDAQGVRREAGNHARVLNKVVLLLREARANSNMSKDRDVVDDLVDSQQGLLSSSSNGNDSARVLSEDGRGGFAPNSKGAPLLLESDDNNKTLWATRKFPVPPVGSSATTDEERPGKHPTGRAAAPLKECIGHTEVEVMAAALLGLFVSMAVYSVL